MSDAIPLTNPVSEARAKREANWQNICYFTGLALQGLLANQGQNVDSKQVAHRAVEIAEAVVAELDRRRSL